MEPSSGWGKPLKKSANPDVKTTPSTNSPVTTTNTTTTPTSAKISTKSEPFIQKTVFEPITLVARAKEGLYLTDDKSNNYISDTGSVICEEATISMFSADGDILAFANPLKIGAFHFSDQNGLTYDLPNVLAMQFSPSGKFIVTIDKRENKHYLTVFDSKTLTVFFTYETTKYKKENWPQLKFTSKEELAFRSLSQGRIEALDPSNKFGSVKVLEVKPFDFFNVSKIREELVIVCVNLEHTAGYDKNEGKIDIHDYDTFDGKPKVSKIIDKAHEVNLFFSPTKGHHLLVWAQTFTDKTGQSYYGEHILFYLDWPKKTLKRVPTYKGPIHDVAWNPNGQEFIAISGFMPAGTVLFTNDCVPKFEFGVHHRNTIRWSPFSRFILLGGFGNLSGEMEIWEASSLTKIGTCKSNSAVSCIWAPDARRILTGVLNPRLRVDNGYKIFKYTGELLNSVDFSKTELYEVIWRPGQYTDKPSTPVKKSEKKEEEVKQAFRPKGATGGGGSFAAQLAQMRGQKDTKTNGRVLDPDEIFNNEANLEPKEEPKKKKRIRKKKDKKGDEEAKDDDDGYDDDK